MSSQKKNLYNSNTLGRASGSAFLRQTNDRRSLRVSPPSPPPIRRVVEPPPPVRRAVDPPLAVTLTPLNNNRTSALRASLRMKNPFTSMASSFQSNSTPAKSTLTRQPTLVVPSSSPSTTKRPTVLQLFTSAFSRPSPVAPAKNRGNGITTTSSLSIGQLGQGRRSEPEGVESKLMTGSCHNYSTPSKIKPSRYCSVLYTFYFSFNSSNHTVTTNLTTHLTKKKRSTPNLGKRLGIGTCLLPNKIRPLTYTKQVRR